MYIIPLVINSAQLTKCSQCPPCHHLVTIFSVMSLLLMGTVLYFVMFSVTVFSGSGWFSSGRNRVTEQLAWLMARDWTASAVKSATCTPSTS